MGPIMMEESDPLEMLDQRIFMQLYAGGQMEKKKLYSYTVVGILEGQYNEHSYQAYAPIDDIKKMRKFMSSGSGYSYGGVFYEKGVMVRGSSRTNSQRNTEDIYDFILVRTAKVEDSKRISQELKDRGYNCWSMADQLEGIEEESRTIQAILGGIGGITLFVAALGITNTMVMSIYERTREIGVMKVIGATFHDIRALFLSEAGMIGFFGGVLGLSLSYIASFIINRLTQDFLNGGMPSDEVMKISLIPPWLAVFAIVFAIFVGLVAGLYPANRAVRLSPVEAIRNE